MKCNRLIAIAKHLVDGYIQQLNLPAVFILTATFYENLITRKHAVYLEAEDRIEFRHPIITEDTGRMNVPERLCDVTNVASANGLG